jgi:four helix bundle protein
MQGEDTVLSQKEKVETGVSEKPHPDIRQRTFDFAVRTVNLVNHIPEISVGRALASQLIRSGTSIGANAQEALAAYSRDDFAYKTSLALKEARETLYWLQLLKATKVVAPARLTAIIDEAEQITRILGSIVSKTKRKRR